MNNMELTNALKNNKAYKQFLFLMFFLLSIIIGLSIGAVLLFKGRGIYLYHAVFILVLFILIGIAIFLTVLIIAVMMLWYDFTTPKVFKKIIGNSMTTIYPLLVILGKVFSYDKNMIRRGFTELNNKLILSNQYNLAGKDILILTPHCIQKSHCPHRITSDIENCKRCGLCNVNQLMILKDKYKTNFKVVTGGTLARKMILDLKPKAIIAIACERDLMSGLQDVKNIPILGIINERPEGPCVNTMVDVEKVEKAILHFIKE